jgi:putative ABC transport system ATP-binding protein
MTPEQAILIRDLNHWYGEGTLRRQALIDINFQVGMGEMVFLKGPSGCGKTTMLTLIGALRSVQEGSVIVAGLELVAATHTIQLTNRRHIGFIFQSHNLHRSLTVLENVFMGLEAIGQSSQPDALQRCKDMLDRVGLSQHFNKRQHQISGGQKQRVAVARALVAKPKIILADEPTAALDSKTGHEVVGLMQSIAKDMGTAVLIVTHDDRIIEFADRVVQMEDGQIIQELTTPSPKFTPNLKKENTRAPSNILQETMVSNGRDLTLNRRQH